MKNNSLPPMTVIGRLLTPGVACGVLTLLVVSGLPASSVRAQETEAPPEAEERVASVGKFPVKIVAGRLVAATELSTIHRRIQVNLFVDFESPFGLRLPDSVAGSLRTEDKRGLRFPGVEKSRQCEGILPATGEGRALSRDLGRRRGHEL